MYFSHFLNTCKYNIILVIISGRQVNLTSMKNMLALIVVNRFCILYHPVSKIYCDIVCQLMFLCFYILRLLILEGSY